jgi:hypothetical protein
VAELATEVRRFDFQAGGKTRRNSSGGLIVSGLFARTGIQRYRNDDGTERLEYRDPAEVFAPETLESLKGAPVIQGHVWVTPDNKSALRIGTTLSAARHAERVDGQEWISSEAVIDDPEAAAKLSENPEVSVAYSHVLDRSRTRAPDGTPVAGWQTQIRANHVGVGPQGWAVAGRAARIALDGNMTFDGPPPEQGRSNGGQKPEGNKKMADMISFDGIQVEKGSDTHVSMMQKALADRDAKIAADGKTISDLSGKVATQDGTIAGLTKKAADAEAALAKATSPEAREDGIRQETIFRDRMRAILGADVAFVEKRADGSMASIARETLLKSAIKKLVPDVQIREDGDATYLEAVLAGAEAAGKFDYSAVAPKDSGLPKQIRQDGGSPKSLSEHIWAINSPAK